MWSSAVARLSLGVEEFQVREPITAMSEQA